MIDGELPASVEGLRRLAFDLGGVRDRVTAVERAVAGRLLPFDTGPGDLVGFDADGSPVLIDAAAGDGYGLTSDISQVGGAKWAPGAQVVSERSARYPAGLGTNFFLIGAANSIVYYTTSGSSAGQFYLDPADWGAAGVSLKLRAWAQTEVDPTDSNIRVQFVRNTGVGTGGTIASGAQAFQVMINNVTAANTLYQAVSSETIVTTAGYYSVWFDHSVNPAQAMSYGYTLMARTA